jgi:threonine aldolase
MDHIDLRSDTVTHPTPAMRRAMAEAEVGDDVKRDDPTVNRLEALAAERLGHEAALLVTSGTQGNLTALLTHLGRGDEYIVGQDAHIFQWEGGTGGAIAAAHPYPVPVQPDGTLRAEDIRRAVRGTNIHHPITRLICLENTHGGRGGVALPVSYHQQMRQLANELGLALHLDGARVWNAAAALGVEVSAIATQVDSVSFCLSKGLCAPVGSVLVGSREFIERARRWRKNLGGGMRQAGVIAAAGIVAIEDMTARLHEDHATAQQLAEGLTAIEEVTLESPPHTNMVFFRLREGAPLTGGQLSDRLRDEHGILLDGGYGSSFRAVTHYWVSPADITATLGAIKHCLRVGIAS